MHRRQEQVGVAFGDLNQGQRSPLLETTQRCVDARSYGHVIVVLIHARCDSTSRLTDAIPIPILDKQTVDPGSTAPNKSNFRRSPAPWRHGMKNVDANDDSVHFTSPKFVSVCPCCSPPCSFSSSFGIRFYKYPPACGRACLAHTHTAFLLLLLLRQPLGRP